MVEKAAPTTEGDIIARKLDCALRHLLRHALVEAESAGPESGHGTHGSASGVAIPPIDLVLNVGPFAIAEIGKKHASRLLPRPFELDKRTLQKFALRAATDDHVYAGGPMSRRSSLVDLGGFGTFFDNDFDTNATLRIRQIPSAVLLAAPAKDGPFVDYNGLRLAMLKGHASAVKQGLQKMCGDTLELMDERLTSTDDAGVSLVFYQKMKADNHCVIADCSSSELREDGSFGGTLSCPQHGLHPRSLTDC